MAQVSQSDSRTTLRGDTLGLEEETLVLNETHASQAAWSTATGLLTSGVASAAATTAVVGAAVIAGLLTLSDLTGIGRFLASIQIGKAAISGRLVQPYAWGTVEGRPACLITMKFEFSSPRYYTLEEARVEFVLGEGKNDMPRISGRAPTELRSESITQLQMSHGSSLAPKVNAGAGGGELGELHVDKTFSRAEGWSVVSNMGSSKGSLVERRVWWDLSSNVLQRQGVRHHLLVTILVEHEHEPISMNFKLSGRLHFWLPRFLRPEKEVMGQKVFPPQPAENVLDTVDLEQVVSENRQAVPGEFCLHAEISTQNLQSLPGFF